MTRIFAPQPTAWRLKRVFPGSHPGNSWQRTDPRRIVSLQGPLTSLNIIEASQQKGLGEHILSAKIA